MTRFLPLIIIMIITLFSGYVLLSGKDPKAIDSALIGKSVPNITFPAATGYKDIPPEYFLNNHTLVNFFSSWCTPCKIEHPELMELKSEGVNIVGVIYNDKEDKALAFLKNNGNPYSNIVKALDDDLAFEWGVYGIPETFFVDDNGIVQYRHTGVLTLDIYYEALNRIKEQQIE